MSLAHMMAMDEAALICDFAESYHIVDFKALPAQLAALFACGLGDDSRIKRAICGARYSLTELLLALAVDHLAIIAWQSSTDGHAGRNRPKSIYAALVGQKDDTEIEAFDSVEAFKAARYGEG